MNTQASAMTHGQFATQFNALMPNVYTIPSQVAGGRIVYVGTSEERAVLPDLIILSGARTNVARVFDEAFPVSEEGEEGMLPHSATSTFVSRVKYLDGLMDQSAERVLIGLRGRPHNTFKNSRDMKGFFKFIEFHGTDSIRDRAGGGVGEQSVADDALIAAERTYERNAINAARAYFVSGILFAAQKGAPYRSLEFAAKAFWKTAQIYFKDGRYAASAMSSELAAKISERSDEDSKSLRNAAAKAWLNSVETNTKYEEDSRGHMMEIFRGMANAERAGNDEMMITFWDISAKFFAILDNHLEAAHDCSRIVATLAAREMDAGNKSYWTEILPRIGTVIQSLHLVEGQKDLIADLRELSDEVSNAAAAVGG